MLIHIGWNVTVSLDRVLCVLSAKTVQAARQTKEIIDRARQERRFTPCPDQEKAYVLCTGPDGAVQVIASSISPATLRKRLERPEWE